MNIRRNLGLTLIETVIGICILGLLVVGALPNFSIFMQNTRTRNTAESILNGMQLARGEAIRRNSNVQFVLNGSTWAVSVARSGQQIQSRPAGESIASTQVTVTPLGASTLTFNSLGRVVLNADGSAAISQIDVDSTSIAPPDSRPMRTTVGIGGNIRMCDPQVGSTDPRACS